MSRDAAKAKRKILSAAASVLRSHGAAGLTTERIARAAGCAKGLVNYHYARRSDLLTALISDLADGLVGPRLDAMTERGTAVVDRTWDALVQQVNDRSILAWLAVSGLRSDKLNDRTVSSVSQRSLERWTEAVEQWMQRSNFGGVDPSDVARASWALLDGFGLALLDGDTDGLYPAYLTAWLGLIGALSEARH